MRESAKAVGDAVAFRDYGVRVESEIVMNQTAESARLREAPGAWIRTAARPQGAGLVACVALALVMLSCTRTTVLVDPTAAGAGRYSSAPTSAGWGMWPPGYLFVVMTSAQYEVVHYKHQTVEDGLVQDGASPTGFALLPGDEGEEIERRSESVCGTGVAMRGQGNTYLVLTSHHVVDFPETLRLEVSSPLLKGSELLVGWGERKFQSTVVGRPGEGQAQATIVAFSREADLALLRVDLRRFRPYVTSLPCEFGSSDAIRTGDGVYILGAPDGKFQVTWGIVTPEGPTLLRVDTSTPAGYSGGVLLGTNRETGQMELLGVVRGTAGSTHNVWEFDESVVPGMTLGDVDPSHVIARTLRRRDFGVTYCTPVGRVRAFLDRAFGYAAAFRFGEPKDLDRP